MFYQHSEDIRNAAGGGITGWGFEITEGRGECEGGRVAGEYVYGVALPGRFARMVWWVAGLTVSRVCAPRSGVVELAAAIAIAVTARAVLASVVSFMVGRQLVLDEQ